MAETPPANEALLREVDDAVRQDLLFGFWRRFGRWVIGAVVVGLGAFGGWLYWQHHSKQASGDIAEIAQDVVRTTVAEGGKPDRDALAAMESAGQPGYRAMAMLTTAGMAARDGKAEEAARLYGEIAANEEIAQPYRELATVRQVALTFDRLPPQQVIDRLKPLAVEGKPWFGSAGEMTAIAYMKMRQPQVAGPIFAAISRDPKVPETLRSRARQMAGLLGVDAVDTEEDGNGKNEGPDAATQG